MSQPLVQEPTPFPQTSTPRVWTNPESYFERMAAITQDLVLFANPGEGAKLDQAVEALERDGTLPSGAKPISCASITKVVASDKDTRVVVYYSKSDTEHKSAFFTFGDAAKRNDFVAALQARFGDSFQEKIKVHTALTASVKPLSITALVALFTWLFHMAAVEMANGSEATIRGSRRGIKMLIAGLLDVVGPIGVLIAGGITLALCIWVLVRRISDPPTLHILQRVA